MLDVAESVGEGGGVVRHYLVTWRSLPYEEATWELEKDVDKVRVVVEMGVRRVWVGMVGGVWW